MKRSAPIVIVTVGLLLVIGWYTWYERSVYDALRVQVKQTGELFGTFYTAASDSSSSGQAAALNHAAEILARLHVPAVVVDPRGKIVAVANLPGFPDPINPGDPRVRAYIDVLDEDNVPVTEFDGSVIHFGNTPMVNGMRVIPVLQLGVLVVLLLAGVSVLLTRGHADRESIFAGMARESAHQLGTPLSSMHGWLELLRERDDPMVVQALPHMESDIERLERVAHRFERIGRPPKRDPVDVHEVAQQVVQYFSRRVPTLAHAITIHLEHREGPGMTIAGDRVLLEWAIESIVKNAIDALAGRGGNIVVSVQPVAGSGIRVRIADDGPGIPRELRRKIFHAGFTTKESGWGIGLALTRRIVEENHGGRVTLQPSERGAVFDLTLPG
jgi:signal transduction histidine kinase